jgi:hypothetical protein
LRTKGEPTEAEVESSGGKGDFFNGKGESAGAVVSLLLAMAYLPTGRSKPFRDKLSSQQEETVPLVAWRCPVWANRVCADDT